MLDSPHLSPISSLFHTIQNASLPRLSVGVAAFLLTYWTLHGLYRITFHPLRAFPGPRLSAFTQLPKNTALWTGSLHTYVAALHAQYGEIVRIAPNELSFIHPDAWRDIYGHGVGRSAAKGFHGSVPPKFWHWYGTEPNGTPNLAQTPGSQDHARVRRVFKPAFSDRGLKAQEPLFERYVEQLVENLKKEVIEGRDVVDVVRNYNFTTFDVMGDLTFGESLHMLDDSRYDPWVALVFASVKFSSRFSILASYSILSRLITSLLPASFAQKKIDHFRYSVDRVTKRLSRGRESQTGSDLWDLVLAQTDAPQLSRAEMDSNSSLFMLAGTETTATLLSGLTYRLLKNPDKLTILRNEIRAAFPSPSTPMHMESLAALPYLGACIKEGLRMYPPVAIGLPHVTPANGSTICGQYVPPGMTVSAPHHAMYRSPLNFTDPDTFAPERWLGDDRFAGDRRTAFQPFSVGARDCLGKNMAHHEMRLILAKMLQNFDLQLSASSENWAETQKVFSVWEKPPLMVRLVDASS